MLHALARVAKEARLAADLRQLDIATAAGVSHETISRFERADGWPLEADRIISIWEKECGLEPGSLWKRAAERLQDRQIPKGIRANHMHIVPAGMSVKKELKEIRKAAEKQDWGIKELKNGHLMYLAPDGINKVTASGTPSARNAIDHLLAVLRRYGFEWKGR